MLEEGGTGTEWENDERCWMKGVAKFERCWMKGVVTFGARGEELCERGPSGEIMNDVG